MELMPTARRMAALADVNTTAPEIIQRRGALAWTKHQHRAGKQRSAIIATEWMTETKTAILRLEFTGNSRQLTDTGLGTAGPGAECRNTARNRRTPANFVVMHNAVSAPRRCGTFGTRFEGT
jgi:hypothetical protein